MINIVEQVTAAVSGRRTEPGGTIHMVDGNALNWLYITYNTVEESEPVTDGGRTEAPTTQDHRWVDDLTLEVNIRGDEVRRWRLPHPPGSAININQRTECEVTGERSVRFYLPEPDGGLL